MLIFDFTTRCWWRQKHLYCCYQWFGTVRVILWSIESIFWSSISNTSSITGCWCNIVSYFCFLMLIYKTSFYQYLESTFDSWCLICLVMFTLWGGEGLLKEDASVFSHVKNASEDKQQGVELSCWGYDIVLFCFVFQNVQFSAFVKYVSFCDYVLLCNYFTSILHNQ